LFDGEKRFIEEGVVDNLLVVGVGIEITPTLSAFD
jgi:hypothetical protein